MSCVRSLLSMQTQPFWLQNINLNLIISTIKKNYSSLVFLIFRMFQNIFKNKLHLNFIVILPLVYCTDVLAQPSESRSNVEVGTLSSVPEIKPLVGTLSSVLEIKPLDGTLSSVPEIKPLDGTLSSVPLIKPFVLCYKKGIVTWNSSIVFPRFCSNINLYAPIPVPPPSRSNRPP